MLPAKHVLCSLLIFAKLSKQNLGSSREVTLFQHPQENTGTTHCHFLLVTRFCETCYLLRRTGPRGKNATLGADRWRARFLSCVLGYVIQLCRASISLHRRLSVGLDFLFAIGAENTDTGLRFMLRVKDSEKPGAHSIPGLHFSEISRNENNSGTRKLFCPFFLVI